MRKKELRDAEEREFPGGVSSADANGAESCLNNRTGIPARVYGEKITQLEANSKEGGSFLPPNEEIVKT